VSLHWKRWKLTRGAALFGKPIGYLPAAYFPFRWQAELGAWLWLNVNFFWGELVANVRKVECP
jgi:hypothetical protein